MILGHTTHPPIGLDPGGATIHAAQTDRSGAVVAAAAIPRAAPDTPCTADEFAHLQGVLYRQGFRGSRVHLAAPKQIVSRTTLDLPPRDSGAPIDEIARGEIARQTKADPRSFEFAWWDAPQPPRHGASIRAITVTCHHETASALIGAVEQAGFRVEGLFSPSTAAAAVLTPPPPGATAAAVDLGWTDATLILTGHDSIVFERQLTGCGLSACLIPTAKALGIEPAELSRALAHARAEHHAAPEILRRALERYTNDVSAEVRSTVDYVRGCANATAPDSLCLVGGGAAVPGITEAIANAAGIPVTAYPGPSGPALATAVGLAGIGRCCQIAEAA